MKAGLIFCCILFFSPAVFGQNVSTETFKAPLKKTAPKAAAKPTAKEPATVQVELAFPDTVPSETTAPKNTPAPVPPAAVAPALQEISSAPVAAAPAAKIEVASLQTTTSAAGMPFDNTVPPTASEKPPYSEIVTSLSELLALSSEEKAELAAKLSKDEDDYDSLKKKYDQLAKEITKNRKELLLLREEYDRITGREYIAEIINDRLEPDQKAKYKTMLDENKAATNAKLAPPVAPSAAPAPVATSAPQKEPAKAATKQKKAKPAPKKKPLQAAKKLATPKQAPAAAVKQPAAKGKTEAKMEKPNTTAPNPAPAQPVGQQQKAAAATAAAAKQTTKP